MDKPVTFKNGKQAKNSFAIAALTNCQSNKDGTLHENEEKWLLRRVKGGYGIITSCCVHVQANGKGWEGEWACFGDQHTPGYKKMAESCRAGGALFVVQIFHAGMRADEKLFEGDVVTCVDYTYTHRAGERQARQMTEAEIEALIEDFVKAAKRCEEAGADGIEIHAAHGYIITQFLCPVLNTRTDKWGGGPLENRARLMREVTKRIRAAVKPGFIVGIRLGSEAGYEAAGWSIDMDENVQAAKWAVEDGVDYISVSVFGDSHNKIAKLHEGREDAKTIAATFRDAVPKESKVVLMVCGGVASGAHAKALMGQGVDVVVTGKTCIHTPDFPQLVQADPSFACTAQPPFTPEFLASVDVSPPFVEFLKSMHMVA
mmetsp:Transcript_10716/g.26255  ORF Transcript_10716/g.26255 Transcript_10716/m.26255 type:complete len:373 (-) Transcript_10716:279-1397(-)|eukprot:CAMPEP_0206232768 /NCGR_PEP_ID=MMETSP0047_2-20121206/11600_1 /ASSEMBLY_ACC=CAM_ASM_000192 /TAXON_ID=195065 /ORGANISM="Chroomonas mesostigmatica_cf, Strain CCMP1168" /LENGTH=372 /DNA_ID=CAMNT_0053656543 /DNA_START=57 /DNA_END=1175 /DNA_ORIENTATION=+